ncbi:uncharacterized protein LOC144634776 isoform X3 [Oculina patagonica]
MSSSFTFIFKDGGRLGYWMLTMQGKYSKNDEFGGKGNITAAFFWSTWTKDQITWSCIKRFLVQ